MKIEVGDDVELRVIHRGVGGITEGDINLAIADNVIVLGFNVRAEGKATELANREGVEIRYYSVIYQAIEEIEQALKGMLKPEFEEVELGRAEVREVFKSSRVGTIAGCLVMSGVIRRNARGRLLRDSVVIAENLPISSLRRFKDDVVEVREGFECGFTLGNYSDIKVGDVVETFEMREKPAPDRSTGRRSRLDPRRPVPGYGRTPCTSERWSWTSCSGTSHSLKQKRSVVRPVLAELRRRFEVAVAEAGHLDLHRRALLGVSLRRRRRGARDRGAGPLRAAGGGASGAGAALGPAPDDRPGGRLAVPIRRRMTDGEVAVRDGDRVREGAQSWWTRHGPVGWPSGSPRSSPSALEHEVKDPRLAMVTITDTRVTGDLRDATVYYTVLGARSTTTRTPPAPPPRWPAPPGCCGRWSARVPASGSPPP